MAATTPANWQPADIALTRFSADGHRARAATSACSAPISPSATTACSSWRSTPAWGRGRPMPSAASATSGARAFCPTPTATSAAGRSPRASSPTATAPCSTSCPTRARRTSSPSAIRSCRTPDGPLIRTPGRRARARAAAPSPPRAGARPAVTSAPRAWPSASGIRRLRAAASTAATASTAAPMGTSTTPRRRSSELRRAGLIEYRPGLHVDRVSEQRRGGRSSRPPRSRAGRGVSLRARAGVPRRRRRLDARSSCSARACLPSAREIADSQALYLPFAWVGRIGRTGREPGHTLAQASIVLEDPAVCANPMHITLYTYNDGLSERARASTRASPGCSDRRSTTITRRLVIGICFFHSEDSDRVAASCATGQRLGAARAACSTRVRAATMAALPARAARAPLGRVGLRPAGAARGARSRGRRLPLRRLDPDARAARPSARATRSGARPRAARIHVVDSSCFPSVPGGAITLLGDGQRLPDRHGGVRRGRAACDRGHRRQRLRRRAHPRPPARRGFEAVALVRRPRRTPGLARRYALGEPLDAVAARWHRDGRARRL